VSRSNTHPLVENGLLARLPRAEFQRLQPHLQAVDLAFKQVLYEPGDPIEHVYFPRSGVISWVTHLYGGSAVETATIGREGVVGICAFLRVEESFAQVRVQVPGAGDRLSADVLTAAAASGTALHTALACYASAMLVQMSQSVACNAVHTVRQRCCRWLLMAQDRVQAAEFPLTHEFLAQMLAVRRPSVTEVAGRLQQEGLIDYSRGMLRIRNRRGLEAASCECYRAVTEQFNRLLGRNR
jgi:CRP-like cAMP-binding protein